MRTSARVRVIAISIIAASAFGCGGGGGGDGGDGSSTNMAPIASFTATPNAGLAALTVSLNGSDSRDPDGQIASYSWNFGDSTAAGTGAVVTHTFQNPGQYTVTLTVRDDRGASNFTSTVITVRAVTAAVRYSVKFLPFPGTDYRFMYPVAIDDSGRVAGEMDVGSNTRAFIYANDMTRELGTLGGGDSAAWAINAAGVSVGYSATAAGMQRAVRFENGAVVDLGTLVGESAAFGINVTGRIVGAAVNGAGQVRAVVFESGAVNDLGTLGGTSAMAFAINDLGQIVGQAATTTNKNHAFLFQNGRMEDLGTLGGDESAAVDINRSGQILGWSDANFATGEPGYGYLVGFVYQNGTKTEIRPPQARDVYPSAINDLGQVVGLMAETDDLDDYPFIWHPSNGIRNLNSLIDPAVGCRLNLVGDMNNVGQIVGVAACEDGRYPWGDSGIAVILTPES